MKKRINELKMVAVMVSILNGQAGGSGLSFSGQFSGWGLAFRSATRSAVNQAGGQVGGQAGGQAGGRYLPAVLYGIPLSTGRLDMELSGNLYQSYSREGNRPAATTESSEWYRLWVRYATPQFEARLGLQKINFGPARLLRSLMWFDRLDPRDPLQLASGVYALRLRVDYTNNVNVWVWGLYGNPGTKGWEAIPSAANKPEVGGRWQLPVGTGELAFTAHQRILDGAVAQDFYDTADGKDLTEKRVALDGFWDYIVGMWFETALVHTNYSGSGRTSTGGELDWQSFLTLGTDYTLSIGNGLHLTGEHLTIAAGGDPYGGASTAITGLMLIYPLGIMDQVSYFSFYNWDQDRPFYYLSWQRTYDRWIVHLSGFWSKAGSGAGQALTTVGIKGFQLLVIFNH